VKVSRWSPRSVADRAVPLVFLEGDPGYYSRFGFAPAGKMTGTLVYSQPFWSHDAVGLRDPNA